MSAAGLEDERKRNLLGRLKAAEVEFNRVTTDLAHEFNLRVDVSLEHPYRLQVHGQPDRELPARVRAEVFERVGL